MKKLLITRQPLRGASETTHSDAFLFSDEASYSTKEGAGLEIFDVNNPGTADRPIFLYVPAHSFSVAKIIEAE